MQTIKCAICGKEMLPTDARIIYIDYNTESAPEHAHFTCHEKRLAK